ncbi:MAG TPA: ABC transporter ATP-binding protein [Chloroflexia bacterium]
MSQTPMNPAPPTDVQDPARLTLELPAVSQSPARARSIIEVRNVSKVLGGNTVLHDLNFEVYEGEIFGFIGPSGSGKTTAIRLLTGVYTPTTGEVTVMGTTPSHPDRRVQEHFGYMPQMFVLYPNLTVRENLLFVAELYGMGRITRNRRVKELLEFVELTEARNRLASKVSGGMQRRMELAAALLHNPALIFADEPTAGIDPVLRAKFWEEFRLLRDEGRTLFITTQYVGESEYCDRVGVIREGRIVAIDTPIGLRRRAFGGDMVDVVVNGLSIATVQALEDLPIVKYVQPVSRNELRVSVEESGPAIPALLEALNTLSCEVKRIEEYRPNFDEVFISLMEQDEAARAEQEAATPQTGTPHV